jgi:putative transposase
MCRKTAESGTTQYYGSTARERVGGETREAVNQGFDHYEERFEPKFPIVMACLAKDTLLTFYDYPAKNWQPIRTTNPVEFVFATVWLRTTEIQHCCTQATTLAMAF